MAITVVGTIASQSSIVVQLRSNPDPFEIAIIAIYAAKKKMLDFLRCQRKID